MLIARPLPIALAVRASSTPSQTLRRGTLLSTPLYSSQLLSTPRFHPNSKHAPAQSPRRAGQKVNGHLVLPLATRCSRNPQHAPTACCSRAHATRGLPGQPQLHADTSRCFATRRTHSSYGHSHAGRAACGGGGAAGLVDVPAPTVGGLRPALRLAEDHRRPGRRRQPASLRAPRWAAAPLPHRSLAASFCMWKGAGLCCAAAALQHLHAGECLPCKSLLRCRLATSFCIVEGCCASATFRASLTY